MMSQMMKRSVVVFALAVAAPLVASDGRADDWWIPGSGVVKLYSWDETIAEAGIGAPPLVTDSYSVPIHAPFLEPMELVEEDSAERRVHADYIGGQDAIGSGAGLGAGLGKGGSQVTLADANAANLKAAGAAVVQSNALNSGHSVRGVAIAEKEKVKQIPIPAALTWFAWMRLSMSFPFVVKSLCMVCNIFYQASPLPLVNGFNEKGDTGGADLAPFVAVAYGGWQWCFYGLFAYFVTNKSGFLVLVYSNVVGATLGLYYVYSFTSNCRNAAMLERSTKYYYVLASIVAIQLVAIMTMQPVRALFFSGLISSAWSVVSSASLISTVPVVYEQRNSRSLPLPLVFMGEISAVLWIVCGVMLWDPWITFPNIFAFSVCTFALYLCAKFPPHGCEGDDGFDEVDVAKAAAKDAAAMAVCDEDSGNFSEGRASPLQRAVGFVLRGSPTTEKERLSAESLIPCYGGTGGTGDGF